MPVSPIIELAGPVAVVAHDAGAANLILAWLDPARPPRATLQGPAERLWRARMGNAPLCADIAEALREAAVLVSGTGWASDLEHRARVAARARGLRSIAVVDHWVNYHARFERDGEIVLPDEIWVTDTYALQLARAQFDVPVTLQPNLYLQEQLAGIGAPANPRQALFVLEPARSDWGLATPGEFQALDYFMAHRSLLGLAADDPVVLRPHPSDPPGKYDAWLAMHPTATLDQSASLAQAIGAAGLVVGLNSNAMVVALAAGRRVVTALPPWAPPCILPQAGIIALTKLVRNTA